MKKNITKLLLTGASLGVFGGFSHAQGLEKIIVEPYYVSNAADAAGSVGALPVGSVTYRVFVDMLPGYKFEALYGVAGHPLNINTTTTFFNNEDYGATTPSFTKAHAAGNSVMLDSWFSVGAACNGQMGILKTEDDGVATVVNTDGILQATNPIAGIPLTTQDGFIAGSPNSVTFVGLTTELDVFDALSGVGSSFTTTNGSVASLTGSMGPTATNRVLVGQFTTNGIFHFELNVQLGTPTAGGVENYVASSPTGSEFTDPTLTYTTPVTLNIPDNTTPAAASVSVYPSPATENVKIDITSSSAIKNSSYRIINYLGDVVEESTLNNYQTTIGVQQLPSGIYFVEVNLDGVKTTKKIIKN
ncbi:MAG: T9SS type A sorting domain-containing protein [Bacteroidia bacterium]